MTTSFDQQVIKTPNKTLLSDSITLDSDTGPLTRQTLETLYSFFISKTTHRPSMEMWVALKDLAQTMERMADGTCPEGVYLSSLDPGVGKTQTITHLIQALMASEDHKHVSILICVSRLSEIRGLVDDMGLEDWQFAVLTSDQELNALGTSPAKGRVLFTTQQMVEKRCSEKAFKDAYDFKYRGQMRQVRIWDESILPGQTITLNRDDLGFLFKPLRGTRPELAQTIEEVFTELRGIEDGTTYQLPDFAEEHGLDVNNVLRILGDARSDEQAIASSLWFLSGRFVSVRQDNLFGNTMLDYRETLPADLPPLVVLDASGRVRATYKEWEDSRGDLIRLASASKSYSNLNVHVWHKGGGKSAFRSNGQELVEGITATIKKKPDEEWLIVCHKPTLQYDVESEVRDLVEVDGSKLHFINWGNHHATNAYSHVSNVILAGTLFYRTSYYESLGRLAAGYPAVQGKYAKHRRMALELGEHAHLVLQALCRGAVRICEDGVCAPCDAFIIASIRSGIPEALPTIFPGCYVSDWDPLPHKLSGKVLQAVEYIERRLEQDGMDAVKFKEVRDAIGVSSSGNFAKNIRRHPDFEDALAQRRIIEHGSGKYHTEFLKLNAEFYGFEEVVSP